MGLTAFWQVINYDKIKRACDKIDDIADGDYLAAENLVREAADIAKSESVFNYNGKTMEQEILNIAETIKATRSSLKTKASTTRSNAYKQYQADNNEVSNYQAQQRQASQSVTTS